MTNPESRDAVPDADNIVTVKAGPAHLPSVIVDRDAVPATATDRIARLVQEYGDQRAAEARQDSLDEVERLRTALTALVRKMDHVHDSEAYKAHWFAGHAHVGPYSGPTYTDELDAARALTTTEAKPKP